MDAYTGALVEAKYDCAAVRIPGNEHALGITLNEACVGIAGPDVRSVLQLASARAAPRATPAVMEIFIEHSLRLSGDPGRERGLLGRGSQCGTGPL
jgi:hypothetical protein